MVTFSEPSPEPFGPIGTVLARLDLVMRLLVLTVFGPGGIKVGRVGVWEQLLRLGAVHALRAEQAAGIGQVLLRADESQNISSGLTRSST